MRQIEGPDGKKSRRRQRRSVIESARLRLFLRAEEFAALVGAQADKADGSVGSRSGRDPQSPAAIGRMVEKHLEAVASGQKRPTEKERTGKGLRGEKEGLLQRLRRRLVLAAERGAGQGAASPSQKGASSVRLESGSPSYHSWNPKDLALEEHPLIVLYRPEIPPNTGTVARLCAAFRMKLVLVGPIGFDLSEKAFRRAGLDYWPWVDMTVCQDWDEFLKKWSERRLVFFETSGSLDIGEFEFGPSDALVFGPETSGVPAGLLERAYPSGSACVRIPMWQPSVRSINLANSVSIAATHALHRKARVPVR